MKIIKRSYSVFHVIVKDNITFIYGNCTPVFEVSSKTLRLSCRVNKVFTTDNINEVRLLIKRLIEESYIRDIRLCCLFSRSLISKLLNVPVKFIKKIPIQCEHFPYVSLGEVDIVRKIGILHLINEIFIESRLMKRNVGDYERVCIIHYILMLLGYNYDPSMISLGRVIYEKYRVRS